jgi:hypothetical protein
LVTPVPLSPLLLLCCAYGGGSIKISLQAMPYITTVEEILLQLERVFLEKSFGLLYLPNLRIPSSRSGCALIQTGTAFGNTDLDRKYIMYRVRTII